MKILASEGRQQLLDSLLPSKEEAAAQPGRMGTAPMQLTLVFLSDSLTWWDFKVD